MDGVSASVHVTLPGPGDLRVRLFADRDMVVTVGGMTLELTKAMGKTIDVPVDAGPISLAIGVPKPEPGGLSGLWLTALSFHPAGMSARMGAKVLQAQG